MSRYPRKQNLCVQPTEQESQFESFQSIIAEIMNANDDSPFQLLLKDKGIHFYELSSSSSSSRKDGIYSKPPVGGSTHYYAMKDGIKLDPYKFYQPKDTQGFCQLFAYFLYIGEPGFIEVDMSGKTKVGIEEFDAYADNTLKALQIFLTILETNDEILERFKQYFSTVDKAKHGIKSGTRAETFLRHCRELDLQDAKYYIYDLQLKGYTKKASKPELWWSFNQK
jgi:hypothetical protein